MKGLALALVFATTIFRAGPTEGATFVALGSVIENGTDAVSKVGLAVPSLAPSQAELSSSKAAPVKITDDGRVISFGKESDYWENTDAITELEEVLKQRMSIPVKVAIFSKRFSTEYNGVDFPEGNGKRGVYGWQIEPPPGMVICGVNTNDMAKNGNASVYVGPRNKNEVVYSSYVVQMTGKRDNLYGGGASVSIGVTAWAMEARYAELDKNHLVDESPSIFRRQVIGPKDGVSGKIRCPQNRLNMSTLTYATPLESISAWDLKEVAVLSEAAVVGARILDCIKLKDRFDRWGRQNADCTDPSTVRPASDTGGPSSELDPETKCRQTRARIAWSTWDIARMQSCAWPSLYPDGVKSPSVAGGENVSKQ